MADTPVLPLPQFQPGINTPTPVPSVSDTTAPQPLAALGQGIQSGIGLGFQNRIIQAQVAERQAQLIAAQTQAKMAQQKMLTDTLMAVHENFKTLSDINPDHAIDYYNQAIVPLHNQFLRQYGVQINPDEMPTSHANTDQVSQINDYMDMALKDPSKVPLALTGLSKISNSMDVGKLVRERAAGSVKTVQDIQSYNKNQEDLEKGYAEQLNVTKARTGGYGGQDQKVNQAVHLRQLINQYHDPKTGNYNVPKAQYTELVLGLANLLSPTGTAAESTIKDLQSMTGKGNLAGAVQYVTGIPQTGNTQAIIKNLVDSIDRQGMTSQQLRDAYINKINPPLDLEPQRAQNTLAQGRGSNYSDFLPKNQQANGMIRVRNKATGQTGQIPADKFNTEKYERLQ